MRRWLFSFLLMATVASAQPLQLSVNLTTGGHWLDGAKASAAHDSLALDGGGFSLGGTLDVFTRVSRFRLGGQFAVDALISAGSVSVRRSAPLSGGGALTSESPDSVLFFSLAPFAGVLFGDGEPFQASLDVLLPVELLAAKVDGARYLSVVPVPTARLTLAVLVPGLGLECSVLGSYFGSARLALAMGLRF